MLTGFPAHTNIRQPVAPAAALLQLAAAPVFLTLGAVVATGEAHYPMCSAPHATFSLSGMPLMYLLMGIFHGSVWLKLIAQIHRRGARVATAAGAVHPDARRPARALAAPALHTESGGSL
jgi:hypothetical protein